MEINQVQLSANQMQIVRAILYFDIFKYPLTREELYENSAVTISQQSFNFELNGLLDAKLFKEEEGFILALERTTSDIIRRLKGNEGATKMLPVALKYSRKIARFPFVECVCISGSLSKNYFDEKSDIDYFIITKPNRLWLCRTFLILFYKLSSSDKKKLLCTNYFITSDSLGIPDMNSFTGTELAFLIPTVNYNLYKKLTQENNWYMSSFPNKKEASDLNCIETPNPYYKKLIEKVLGGWLGRRLENYLLEVTLKRWRKKFPSLNEVDFELQFRSQKNVCKRHTKGFQNKVLFQWEEKLVQFENSRNQLVNS